MTRVLSGWRCPVNRDHGPVLPLAAPGRWGWMCPHQDHDAGPKRVGSRFLFTTLEVETGLLDGPAPAPVQRALSGTGDKSMPDHPSSPARGRGNPLPRPARASAPTDGVAARQPPSTAAGYSTSSAASDLGLFPAVRGNDAG